MLLIRHIYLECFLGTVITVDIYASKFLIIIIINVIFSPSVDISEESLNRSGCSLPDQSRPKLNTSRERSIQADLTECRTFKDTGVGSSTEMDMGWSTPRKLAGLQPPILSPIGQQRTRPRGSDSSTPDRQRTRRRPRQKESSGLEGKHKYFQCLTFTKIF